MNTLPNNRASIRSNWMLPLLMSFMFLFQPHSQAQSYPPLNPNANFIFNTGVNVSVNPVPPPGSAATITPVAPNAFDPNWRVSNVMTYSTAPAAKVFNPPPGTLPGCAPFSPSATILPYNNWITTVNASCGQLGNYSCTAVTDLYFSRAFNLPTTSPAGAAINSVPFKVEMQIWAADWVYDIWISNSGGTYKAWDSNLSGLPVPHLSQRNMGIKFSWCDFKPGQNIIYIHIKTKPFIPNSCKITGIKVEGWGLASNSYTTVSGPAMVCSGASGAWALPNATTLGYPSSTPTTYSWQNIPGFSGASPNATLGAVAGPNGGVLVGSLYKPTTNGLFCLSTGGFSVTVPPVFSVVGTPSPACSGSNTQIVLTGASSYTWYNSVNSQVIPPPAANGATLTLGPVYSPQFVTAAAKVNGCIYQKNFSIPVIQNPIVNVFSSTLTLCRGQNVLLWSSGSVGNTYTWQPCLPPANPNATSILQQPLSTTVYSLTGKNFNGCKTVKTTTITVHPTPTIGIGTPSALCGGNTTTILTQGGTNYTWSPPFPNASGPGPIVVMPTVTTVYTITGTNAFNCVKTNTTQILVNASPNVVVSPTAICLGYSNTLTASGANSYTWYVWPTAMPGNVTSYPNLSSIVISPTVSTSFSVIGQISNGCTRTYTSLIPMGTPVPLSLVDFSMCTSAAACTVVSANTASNVGCTWSLPGNPVGGTVTICPPAFPYTVAVTATSSVFGSCPNSATATVAEVTNCCSQPTAGLSYISTMQGTMANTSYILDHSIQLSSNTVLKDAEVWLTPDVQITVPTGVELNLDHVHLFACSNRMWEGIKLQAGSILSTPQMTLNQHANSLIEDAKVAVDMEFTNVPPAMLYSLSINLEGVIFNKNHIGIRMFSQNNQVSISTRLGVSGCIFSSRKIPFTSFPQPLTWASSAMVSPGLKTAMNPTTGLNAPYIFPGMTQTVTKAPYANQPGFIGIELRNLTGMHTAPTNSLPTGCIVMNINPGSSIDDDFVLFDGLGYGIYMEEAGLWAENLVFQNMDANTGGDAIRHRIQSTAATCLRMFPGQGNGTFGMRVWDCVKGLHLENVYDVQVWHSVFRSTQQASNAFLPNMPGACGIYANTNRFYYNFVRNEFNNLRKGISFNTPATPQVYDMNGSGPTLGVYADVFYVWANYFGAQVNSSTPYTGGVPNNTEYMETGVELITPNPTGWTNVQGLGHSLGGIFYNKMDRVFRGVTIDCMWDFPFKVNENSFLIEDDFTFGSPGTPAFGYGISLSNSTGNKTISTNTLEAMGNALTANHDVSLVYCDYNLGTKSPHVHCNMTKNAHYGFQFNFRNMGTVWEGNRMCNEWAGLALTNNGVIGPQGTPQMGCENFWEDDPISGCDHWSGPVMGSNAKWETYCDNSMASLSPLYVFPAPMAVPNQNGNSPGGVAYVQTNDLLMSAAHNMPLVDCARSNTVIPNWREEQTIALGNPTEFESNETQQVMVFPNPSDGLLNIFCQGDASKCFVRMFDMQGRLVFEQKIITNQLNSLDLTTLPASVYLLEINHGADMTRKKLIKSN